MLPFPHAVCARCWVGGSPLLLHPMAVRLGRALPCLGVPLRPLAECRRHALSYEGPPPPPLVAAHVKRAQPFGGAPLLITVFLHAAI